MSSYVLVYSFLEARICVDVDAIPGYVGIVMVALCTNSMHIGLYVQYYYCIV